MHNRFDNSSMVGLGSGETPQRQPCTGPSRRAFLKVGFLGGLGLSLGDYFLLSSNEAQAATTLPVKAESAIFVFLAGGLSHIDSFDPKPYAPIEYRGELGTVQTNTGDVVGGLLPRLAGTADKFSIIRSMTHGEAAHERGTHNMLTGYRPSPAIQYPSMGSVVSQQLGSRNDLPAYVAIPNAGNPYLGTGYLSAAHGAFSVGGEPSAANFEVRDLGLPDGVSPERMAVRRSLLDTVDAHFASLEASDALDAMGSYYQRAYALISSQAAREAFAINAEADEVRDRYGRHSFGQSLLMARRLVEGGARFVTVTDGGWDHHEGIKASLEGKLPYVDQGLATLISDLAERGMLEKTLVVLTSEFGRTARLNTDGGRDHWPKAFSTVLAGGGVQGGLIHGETDPRGAEPASDPVGPGDLAATIFTLLGIDPTQRLMSAGNRPIDIVRDGSPVTALI